MKYFLIILVSFFTINLTAQNTNERISAIDKEIKLALDNDNFQKAADLKKEKILVVQIEEAISNEDYQKAADLKEDLSNLKEGNTYSEIKTKENISTNSKNDFKDERTSLIMKHGFFIDGLIGGRIGNIYNPSIGTFGFKLGNKWYFGKNKIYRPGIQLTAIKANLAYNINNEYLGVIISPANLGFANVFEFTENIGAEVNLNVGMTMMYDILYQGNSNIDAYFGVSVTPEVKFRYKQFAVGFEANISNYFYQNQNFYGNGINSNLTVLPINLYSLSIGRKF